MKDTKKYFVKSIKTVYKKKKKTYNIEKKILTRYIFKIVSYFNKKYYEYKKYKLQYPYFSLKHAINI